MYVREKNVYIHIFFISFSEIKFFFNYFHILTWLLWKCKSTSYDENSVNYEPQFHCTMSIIRLAIKQVGLL